MAFDWKAPGKEPKTMDDKIQFSCQIAQVKTMVDGGFRIVLDIGEQDAVAVMATLPLVKKVEMLATLDAKQ